MEPLSRFGIHSVIGSQARLLNSAAKRKNDVRILDIYEGAASVRVNAADWIDYMQMARWNGRWVIVNVLWENAPTTK
jgi:putative lumazine-binding protein